LPMLETIPNPVTTTRLMEPLPLGTSLEDCHTDPIDYKLPGSPR